MKDRDREVAMTCLVQIGSSDIATPRQLCRKGTVRPTELVEALYKRIARCAVLHIQTLAALAKTLQGLPRVAGSAA